jgi:hypothetical protein
MARTHRATRASKAKISRSPTSGAAKRRPKKAEPRGRCGIAQPNPAPQLYFYQVQIKSPEAEDNILRLCFRKESAAGLFADLHDDAEDIRIRTNVKFGVCFLLSASSPNTYQRTGALPDALDSLCTCLDDTFGKRAHPATDAHKEFTSQLRRQLHEVVELPDFHTLRSDTLYEKFADIFVPKNSLTKKEVLDCFQPSFWRPNQRAAYEHLYKSYGDEFGNQVLSDDAGRLITNCLAFRLEEPRLYGVGMAIRR